MLIRILNKHSITISILDGDLFIRFTVQSFIFQQYFSYGNKTVRINVISLNIHNDLLTYLLLNILYFKSFIMHCDPHSNFPLNIILRINKAVKLQFISIQLNFSKQTNISGHKS